MANYEVKAGSRGDIRVGENGETVATFSPGWLIKDMKGDVRGEPATMKLAAPWRGMRYRLFQGEQELASAARPRFESEIGGEAGPGFRRNIATYELELPGRMLQLVCDHVDYAGAAPDYVAGVLQVNVRIPPNAPTGDAVPIRIQNLGGVSQFGVTVAIK